jgi:hypothetical protein
VPAPFVTDLASVPRVFTWLFPRYGRYTKAAVVHDFLCQQFSRQWADLAGGAVRVGARSDADEVFLALMKELRVPKLRRRLMWAAVSWATLLSTATIGRRRVPSSRLLGRVLLGVTLLGFLALLAIGRDWTAVTVTVLGAPIGVIIAGIVALDRPNRIPAYAFVYLLTLAFLPLLAFGIPLGIVLGVYLAIEEAWEGFPNVRRLWRNFTSEEAKLELVGTPQFARLAAISQA